MLRIIVENHYGWEFIIDRIILDIYVLESENVGLAQFRFVLQ